MEPFEEQGEEVTMNIRYLIQMAIENKMPWSSLAHLLTDLAATPVKSKQIIKLLIQELEKWISKVENTSKNNSGFSENENKIETSLQETETGDHEVLDVVKERVVEETSSEFDVGSQTRDAAGHYPTRATRPVTRPVLNRPNYPYYP